MPTKAILTTDCIPQGFKLIQGSISIHGLLASFLCNGAPGQLRQYTPWKDVWPSFEDFKSSMPILLPEPIRRPLKVSVDGVEQTFLALPPGITGAWIGAPHTDDAAKGGQNRSSILGSQERRFKRDWKAVLDAFPDTDPGAFLYHWLIVNTRTFYYDLPLRTKPLSRFDKMALCPYLDCFNHADQGVSRCISISSISKLDCSAL